MQNENDNNFIPDSGIQDVPNNTAQNNTPTDGMSFAAPNNNTNENLQQTQTQPAADTAPPSTPHCTDKFQSSKRLRIFKVVGSDRFVQDHGFLAMSTFLLIAFIIFFSLLIHNRHWFSLPTTAHTVARGIMITFVVILFLAAAITFFLWFRRQRSFMACFKDSKRLTARVLKIHEQTCIGWDGGKERKKKTYGITYGFMLDGNAKVHHTRYFPITPKAAKRIERAQYFNIWYNFDLQEALYLDLSIALNDVDRSNVDALNNLSDIAD